MIDEDQLSILRVMVALQSGTCWADSVGRTEQFMDQLVELGLLSKRVYPTHGKASYKLTEEGRRRIREGQQ